jgi:putative transposase
VERFFRSLKEDCGWQHSFPSFVEAHRAVRRWIGWYNERRPQQALSYLSPRQYPAQ